MATRHMNIIGGGERPARPVLYLVVPCYNEEEVLPQSSTILAGVIDEMVLAGRLSRDSRVLFVDDGSRDRTWEIVRGLHQAREVFTGIKLAHNEGHQNALYAGLMCALDHGCDISVSIDADLQDDVAVISEMVDKYLDGAEIVYGVRNDRTTDTGFKRGTAESYYKLMRALGTEVIDNCADFRLMSDRALEALSQYDEANLFLRGVVPALGFKTDKVYYRRGERLAGESKYPLSKMMALAVEGITSFSVKPMRLITALGALAVVVALVMLVYTIVALATGNTVPGWGSLMVSLWFVGGLIMISLGTTGEYVGKAYLEAKHRPRYIVEAELEGLDDDRSRADR